MSRSALCLALFALIAAAAAQNIRFDEGDQNKTILANFGDASLTVSVLYRGPEVDADDVIVSDSSLFTVGPIKKETTRRGEANYTIPLAFDKDVGRENYTVTIGEESINGTVTAAGFVILQDGVIVSGDNSDGISVGQEGTSTFQVKVVNIDNDTVDISGTTITYKESTGPIYYKEVDEDNTSLTSSLFTLAISQFRVGTGSFMINFETEAIQFQGEFFETVLIVKQQTSPPPPCVALAGDYSSTDGFVRINMFNLLAPPKPNNVTTVTVKVGPETIDWSKSDSTLDPVDQVAAFKISRSGEASLTCDGADAVILGGIIDVTGDGSEDLAKDSIIQNLPEGREGQVKLEVQITVKDSSPDLLGKREAQGLLDGVCNLLTEASNCVIERITPGSAIVDFAALIDEDNAEEDDKKVTAAFAPPECKLVKDLGYDDCDDLTARTNVDVSFVGSSAAGAGLATWTIVLIAVVGAFALILVIVLALWAVYRRSSEQSESDYSSSGPLGVPDPSDLLYEQSIVRDIYGRGDFPDGGPSQAVAEQRAREADLREEFPRPPSSSGLSRGVQTDDASSTYSV